MAEKEEEYRKIREEKLLAFTQNRAAKVIQRAYRKLIKKKKKKRKRKNRKAKKK